MAYGRRDSSYRDGFRVKFLADMGISPKSVDFLKQQGHNAIHLHREGLNTLKDPQIFRKAIEEGRILLTHDLDFGDILSASGSHLPSVVIFRLQNMKPENVNLFLLRIITDHSAELEKGSIVIVTEGRIRIRRLPI